MTTQPYNPVLSIQHVATGLRVDISNYFLTQFEDAYDTQYNSVSAYGRMDPILNYKGTSRKITLGLLIEPPPNPDVIDAYLTIFTRLQKMQYPVYEKGSNALTIQRPPLVLVKLANIIRDGDGQALLCAMNGFTFSPVTGHSPETTPFVCAGDTSMSMKPGMFDPSKDKFYFKTYNVSFNFTPLHKNPLGFIDDVDGQILDPDSMHYVSPQDYRTGESAGESTIRFQAGQYFGPGPVVGGGEPPFQTDPQDGGAIPDSEREAGSYPGSRPTDSYPGSRPTEPWG